MKSRKTWQLCNKCDKKTRSLRLDEGGFICYDCFRSQEKNSLIRMPIIDSSKKSRGCSLKDALNKEYTVKSYKNGGAGCSFPSVLIGYKFKIKLIKK